MKLIVTAFFALFMLANPAHAQVATGAKAPAFSATDALSGQPFSLSDFSGKIVVLEWTNYDCPFVKKHYKVSNMQNLQKKAAEDGVIWVSINSGAKGKQGHFPTDADAAKAVKEAAATPAYYVRDESGEIGKAYGAKATPHMFVIDANGSIAYQGAIDDTPSVDSADIATSKNYVATALDQLLKGKEISSATTKAYGCGVKYAM